MKSNSKNRTKKVETQDKLLNFLTTDFLKEKSRTSVKQLLSHRYICVNGESTTQWDYELNPGDEVELLNNPSPKALHHPKVKIIWENEYLVVVEKTAGISTVNTAKTKGNITVLKVLSDYYKSYVKGAKVFMLSKLEKDASGLVFFAKDRDFQQYVIDNWHQIVKQSFLALIEGHLSSENGIFASPPPDKRKTTKENEAKKIIIHDVGRAQYRVKRENEFFSLLEFTLLTGRNNLIRRQMRINATPVVGDKSGGAKYKYSEGIAIHANKVEIKLPNLDLLKFELNTPKEILSLMRKRKRNE